MSKRVRKGNHPSNPYAEERKTAARLADREGYPFAARRNVDSEPTFVLRGSDPSASVIVRLWATLNDFPGSAVSPKQTAAARDLAARMDAWRNRNPSA